MRRISSLLIMAMAYVSLCLASGGKCGDNVTWELNDEGVLTFSGTGLMKNFSETPWHPDRVKSVVINDGVQSIGKNAFKKCKNLTSVYIPNSVSSIGESAFNGCKSLFDIALPSSVEKIEAKTFANCVQLISITIPYGVKSVEQNAFENCTGLTSVRIASSVMRIGVDAFKNCNSLTDIRELPSCVTKQNFQMFGFNEDAILQYMNNAEVYYAETQVNNNNNASAGSHYNNRPQQSPTYSDIISDVDAYIPQNPTNNENTFVVIIANEDYNRLADVNFARNDGRVFYEYCNKTLGVPTTNIRKYEDATFGVMREALADIKQIAKAYNGDLKVIFYYCGHGAPDEKTSEAYLLPTDAYTVSFETCLAVSSLYEELGLMKTKSTTVFLDACFSGATRDESMLVSARGVAIAPRTDMPSGNVAVLSASSGTETALQYAEQGHGMFTYYLLKKLQETKGNVSLGELSEYVTRKVQQKSTVVNRKSQTPTMLVSPIVSNTWQNWQFKY